MRVPGTDKNVAISYPGDHTQAGTDFGPSFSVPNIKVGEWTHDVVSLPHFLGFRGLGLKGRYDIFLATTGVKIFPPNSSLPNPEP